MIYEPQEDSYMLLDAVKKYATGEVLDCGTGSGIQGITALNDSRVKSVLFSDINPECIDHIKSIIDDKKAKFIVSDLFENIDLKKKFDTIIFNPPYLPEDKYDKTIHNVGGKKGYEIIIRFLDSAETYLNYNGIILIVFSSLSHKNIIDKKLSEKYAYEIVSEKLFFMEKLFVYKIEKKKQFSGHRGLVEVRNYTYKKIVVLAVFKKPKTKYYDAKKESEFLKILNKKNIGPKLYKYDKKNNEIIIEYIRGKRIIEFIKESDKETIKKIIKKILYQLQIMDNSLINKKEMTNPYKHIIVRECIEKQDDDSKNKKNVDEDNKNKENNMNYKTSDYEPIMIDFERCQYTNRPKNITQFIQFLCSGKLHHIFINKKIFINKTQLLNIAKNYHNNYKNNYNKELNNNSNTDRYSNTDRFKGNQTSQITTLVDNIIKFID